MAILNCPCGTQLKYQPSPEGKQLRFSCPTCNQIVVAPATQPIQGTQQDSGGPLHQNPYVADSMKAQMAPAYGTHPQPQTESKNPLVLILAIGGGVALLLFVVMIVGVIALMRINSSESDTQVQVAVRASKESNTNSSNSATTSRTPRTTTAPNKNTTNNSSRTANPSRNTTSTQNTPTKPLGTISAAKPQEKEGFGSLRDTKFTPRTNWQVKVDPAEPFEEPEKKKRIQFGTKARIQKIVVPRRPSPFLAVEVRDSHEEILVYDLRTGKAEHQFVGKLQYGKNQSALSADGKQMATVVTEGTKSGIVVVNTEDGKAIYTIALDRQHRLRSLAFAGPGILVAGVDPGSRENPRIGVWDVVKGEPVADITLQNANERQHSKYDVEKI